MAATGALLAHSPELGMVLDRADAAAYRQVLSTLCSISPLDIRNAVLLLSDGAYAAYNGLTASDMGYVRSHWLVRVPPGGQFSSFYGSQTEESLDSIAYAIPGSTPGGTGYRLLIIYEAGGLLESIHSHLSVDYSGYALASEFGPSFLEYGDVRESEAVLTENIDAAEKTESVYRAGSYYILNRINTGWRLCGHLSRADFSRDFNTTLSYISLMCLVLCLISVMILLPLTKGLLRPIYALKQAMDETAAGDLQARAEVLSGDELGELAEKFNGMTVQLGENIRQRMEAERRAQDTRFALLVSQVNAHFVYNTMSSVNSLARMGDNERVLTMNTALLHILQGTLASQDGELFTTLDKELGLLEQYWQIEQMKNGGDIRLILAVSEELRQLAVPRNFLQPLAENSLHHGLMNEESGLAAGTVTVSARRDGQRLWISVADDGRGISPEILERLQKEQADDQLRQRGRHIGLANLRQRLRLLYGEEAGLFLESGPGATVRLCLPVKAEAGETKAC